MIDEANQHDLEELPEELRLAFLPVHKRAFGLAVGVTIGGGLFWLTLFAALFVDDPPLLPLLANYFPGYTVSLAGAFVGFGWAAFAFFVAAWFCAWVRNFVIATSIWLARTREELNATRDFLDHI